MIYLLYAIHIVICLFLILVVLLQQGKGADLSVFGGGSTMTAFGARGAATLLHKLTVYGFIGFIVTTLAIGIMQGQDQGRTVMSAVEETASAEEAGEEAEPAALEGEPAVEEPAGALPEDTGPAVEEPAGALPEAPEPAGGEVPEPPP